MLTRVDVQSENPFYLRIQDASPSDSIILEKIEGLDPPDIDLFMGDFARDGGYYNGRRVGKRNPVFHVRFNPNYRLDETVSGLREVLYRAFIDPTVEGDAITVILKDDERPDRYVQGYVEKFESDIFTDDPIAMISMICPNPYIWDINETIIPNAGPLVNFVYEGTAESGIELKVKLTLDTERLSIELNSQRIMQLDYNFSIDDEVYINTKRGERVIQVKRDGVTTDILYALSATSGWVLLHRPNNQIKATGILGQTVATVTELRFRNAWWGV